MLGISTLGHPYASFARPLPKPLTKSSKLKCVPLDFREHRILRISFWIKLDFILIEVALAIGFGSCNFKKAYNAAAVLEWAIAFIFTFYVLSFFVDLIPAVGTKHGAKGGETEIEREAHDSMEGVDNRGYGGDLGYGRNTVQSERTLGGNDVLMAVGAKRERDTNGNLVMASNF